MLDLEINNLTEAIENKMDRSKWKIYKFSDLVENIVEKVVPKDSGLKHYIGLEHLDTGSLKINRYGETESLIGDKLKIYKGDLIFAKRNSYLKRVAIADFDAVASAHSMVLRPKANNIDPQFLPFFMMSEVFWKRAIEISVGSLSPTINWKSLAKQEFLLPPKGEQERLSELLWALEGVIEKELDLLVRLTAAERSSIEELMLGKKKLKKQNGNYILENDKSFIETWRMFSIDELCSKVTDGEHLSPNFLAEGKPILSAKDIRDDDIQLENSNFISEEAFLISRKRCDPDFNDVLVVSRGATIGRTTVNKLKTPFALMGSVILLKPNKLIIGDYLGMIIRRKSYQNKLLAISGSTAQQAIYLVDIKKNRVLIPNVSYQKIVVDYIFEFKNRINLLKEKLSISKGLQKSLIDQIF